MSERRRRFAIALAVVGAFFVGRWTAPDPPKPPPPEIRVEQSVEPRPWVMKAENGDLKIGAIPKPYNLTGDLEPLPPCECWNENEAGPSEFCGSPAPFCVDRVLAQCQETIPPRKCRQVPWVTVFKKQP